MKVCGEPLIFIADRPFCAVVRTRGSCNDGEEQDCGTFTTVVAGGALHWPTASRRWLLHASAVAGAQQGMAALPTREGYT